MMEKIEWYKEILELEPNSKVFFPLAKLLVENNDAAQAIQILEQGLERHPDFMEARLFLIELMYRNGMDENCALQVQKLSKLFARYAGFWQAWAACLSTSPGEGDTASIVRFLAAHFLVGPLRIDEVLNLGLAEIVKRHEIKEDGESDTSTVQDNAVHEKESASIELAQPDQAQEKALPEEQEIISEDFTEDAAPAETGPESVGAAINLETLPPLTQEEEVSLESMDNFPVDETEPIAVKAAVVPIPEYEEGNEFADSGNARTSAASSEGESISVRTRSMAEVLADQGDYQGALEIYEELADSEKNPDEAENMRQRIQELRHMVSARVIPEEEPIQMVPPSQKKERLLGILEALAKRVEARMHN